MLFRWFQCTHSTHNPATTELLEKLKTEVGSHSASDLALTYNVIAWHPVPRLVIEGYLIQSS